MGNRWLAAGLGTVMVLATLVAAPVPPAVATLPPVQVVTGSVHTCALAPSGQAYCWGNNGYGQLGDGTTTTRSTPVAVQQGSVTFVSITAGGYDTCGLAQSGQAYCWGANDFNQLGDSTSTNRSTPVAVQQGAVLFTSITGGGWHTCGLTSAGQAYCWGYGGNGNLGDNSTTNRSTPVAVQQGAVTFSSIIGGGWHTCGLTSAGAAWCWGRNDSGQLGDNSTTDRHTPVAVQQGATLFTSITLGNYQTCGLTGGGQAFCWGLNSVGQLGDNTTTDRHTPVAVQQGAALFSSVSAGEGSACGLTSAGAAWCWGYNGDGRVGDGTNTERHTPVPVVGGFSWTAITTGTESKHTCAVKASSQLVYCWGLNDNDQLGDQTWTNRSTPVQAWYLVTDAETSVSVTIDPTLTFTVSSVPASTACGDATTSVASTTNAVTLGHVTSTSTHVIGGQSLNVTTNAANGYTVYVSYSGAMTGASSGHSFANTSGSNASPATWAANGTEAFGYTTQSSSLSGTGGRFHSNKWAALSTSSQEIMRNTTTPGTSGDTNCVAFQASEAGNTPADTYTATVRYDASPSF